MKEKDNTCHSVVVSSWNVTQLQRKVADVRIANHINGLQIQGVWGWPARHGIESPELHWNHGDHSFLCLICTLTGPEPMY